MESKWRTTTDNSKHWISTSRIPVFDPQTFDVKTHTYETMVFPNINGEIQYGDEVECLRTNDEDESYLNHLKMFEKYNNL